MAPLKKTLFCLVFVSLSSSFSSSFFKFKVVDVDDDPSMDYVLKRMYAEMMMATLEFNTVHSFTPIQSVQILCTNCTRFSLNENGNLRASRRRYYISKTTQQPSFQDLHALKILDMFEVVSGLCNPKPTSSTRAKCWCCQVTRILVYLFPFGSVDRKGNSRWSWGSLICLIVECQGKKTYKTSYWIWIGN